MKKKLKLQIEKLSVEQFEAHPDSPMERGTVRGFCTEEQSCGGTNPWGGFCICQIIPSAPPCC
jgi:hypothetical protein